MIPTTVTSSPSTITATNSSNGSNHPQNSCTPTSSSPSTTLSTASSSKSIMIGIVSIILEGRAIAEDEYQQATTHSASRVVLNANAQSSDGSLNNSSASSSVGSAGRHSPKPSTSKAATISGSISSGVASGVSGHVINITTNPHALTPQHFFNDPYSSNSSTSTSSAESTHQRWAQKLCQLRQVSPAASLGTNVEQKIAVDVQSTAGGEPELVALAINDPSIDRCDFEIVRRVALNRGNVSTNSSGGGGLAVGTMGGSNSSSPGYGGSDNFLHSLQSLATTCLRGGGVSASGSSSAADYRYTSLNNSPLAATPAPPAPTPMSSPKYSSYRMTPSPRLQNPYTFDVPGSGSSSGSGIQSPLLTWSPSTSAVVPNLDLNRRQTTACRKSIPATVTTSSANAANFITTPTAKNTTAANATTTAAASSCSPSTYPQQGPHCDQFLRKMGLAKGDAAEAEDHFCDMSFVNITCSRWRAYCTKMEGMIARGEPVCIEVYLGPVSHKILLEQWVITQKEKVPPPTMTLPSLCSAIRSQLYFSQISAWCDLIKKSDNAIYDTGRIIFSTPTGAAGDLATLSNTSSGNGASANQRSVSPNFNASPPPPSSTSPNSSSPLNQLTNALLSRRPRLNIFYRVKPYDSTACFNSKPNTHNFPNVNISENCSISVCLKSLPRINGGIPKTGSAMPTSDEGSTNVVAAAAAGIVGNSLKAAPMNTAQTAAAPTSICDNTKIISASSSCHAAASSTPTISPTIADNSHNSSSANGQHKCKFFIDEEELVGDDEADFDADAGDEDENEASDFTNGAADSSNSSFSSNANLSHREKQLLKYRKRMLKRDKKKHRKPLSNASDASCELATAELQRQRRKHGNNSESQPRSSSCQPMEQGEEDAISPHQEQQQQQMKPYSEAAITISARLAQLSSTAHIEMISTGTQTSMTCCRECGGEKTLICLKCIETADGEQNSCQPTELDEMESSGSLSSCEIIHTPRSNAELLLQAIQRTPKTAKKHKKQMSRSGSSSMCQQKLQNNNHLNVKTSSADGGGMSNGAVTGCQECKRQKTQHNFTRADGAVENAVIVSDEDGDGEVKGGRGGDECDKNCAAADAATTDADCIKGENTTQVMDEESFISSTKLTPRLDRWSLSNGASAAINSGASPLCLARSCTPPAVIAAEPVEGATLLLNCDNVAATPAAVFKTPTSSNGQVQQQQQQYKSSFQHKQTPKPNLLQISCNYRNHEGACGDGIAIHLPALTYDGTPPTAAVYNPLLMRKGLPKVNLTPIFCDPSPLAVATITGSLSSPIPISGAATSTATFSFDTAAIGRSANHHPPHQSYSAGALVDNNSIPVQKSYSAPTLPNSPSPSLSPRFAKQAAIYKRRSRHLSDRSDRSSLGSDEQISDEDFENGIYSPATSPMKNRSRIAAMFGRPPLLGNLEESLLQKRLMPKAEVMGFKVLLGASGNFCPTQLTIPAAAFFYELHGETLSTPYVCDIRLPRKGYSVPRMGTVQATLLNPMGTVVRMFVIPYDMRDMPPLHQTFIRQRILAEASANETTTTKSSNSSSTTNNNNNNNYNNQNNNNNMLNGCDGSSSNNADDDGGGVVVSSAAEGDNVKFAESMDSGSSSIINTVNNNYNNNNNNNSNNDNNNKYRLSPNGGLHGESNLGHFISAEHMKRLRYSIHLRFQTSRSGRLSLHTDIRLLISRRTDCDTAAAHAKGASIEAPNDLVTDTVMPRNPKYSARQENANKI